MVAEKLAQTVQRRGKRLMRCVAVLIRPQRIGYFFFRHVEPTQCNYVLEQREQFLRYLAVKSKQLAIAQYRELP